MGKQKDFGSDPFHTTSLRCTQTWADYLLPKAVAA